MLKKLYYSSEDDFRLGIGLAIAILLSTFLIFGKSVVPTLDDYHTISPLFVFLFSAFIFVTFYSFWIYNQNQKIVSKMRHNPNLASCYHMVFLPRKEKHECKVVKITKQLVYREYEPGKFSIVDLVANYTVEYEYLDIHDEKVRESVTVFLEEGSILLTSLYFIFTIENKKIVVKNRDSNKDNFERTHTRVPVICKNGAVLRKGSCRRYEFIKPQDYYTKIKIEELQKKPETQMFS